VTRTCAPSPCTCRNTLQHTATHCNTLQLELTQSAMACVRLYAYKKSSRLFATGTHCNTSSLALHSHYNTHCCVYVTVTGVAWEKMYDTHIKIFKSISTINGTHTHTHTHTIVNGIRVHMYATSPPHTHIHSHTHTQTHIDTAHFTLCQCIEVRKVPVSLAHASAMCFPEVIGRGGLQGCSRILSQS